MHAITYNLRFGPVIWLLSHFVLLYAPLFDGLFPSSAWKPFWHVLEPWDQVNQES
jgi:hypothetical protein